MVGLMICFLFFWILLVSLFSKKNDFFSVLVFLEVLVLLVFLGSLLGMGHVESGVTCYLLTAYLCFGVCEAVIGLSLMVGSARSLSFQSSSFTALRA
uniref:NADH dehydrogenase subunit 4L n=1 Tax=Xylonora corona TaxID=2939326 RepID=UPI0020285DAB|nr:NADH dehydrogenase subunit 4L [Xylonora corona]UPX88874.1 NADH dehydrogenase subunit 4L [Xylonora corona]